MTNEEIKWGSLYQLFGFARVAQVGSGDISIANTYKEAMVAIGKQIPKPHIAGRCPACDANIIGYQNIPYKYCPECGQRIEQYKGEKYEVYNE